MANKFRFTNEKCPVCNNTFNPDDDIVVCPECGTPTAKKCPGCGKDVKSGIKFCPECGQKLG